MKIGNVAVSTPVMNAACSVAKTVDDIKALCATKAEIVLVGSITIEPREGNPEPRWFVGDGYALNSFGMPNGGLRYYSRHLPDMAATVHEIGKRLSISIAGFTTEEYVRLAQLADESQADLLELNLGCPNINSNGVQKSIPSFDTDLMTEIINAVSATTALPLMLKLSPYSNPAELAEVAKTIIKSGKVAAVVTANTFPNGLMLRNNTPVLGSNLGGVSGKAMLPIGLGQVAQFRKLLPRSVAIVGVGGIESAADATLYRQAGADMVQAATLIVRDGYDAINKLIK